MSNNEIKTLCGKTMKQMLYKYHQKKCNECKGNNPKVNFKFLEDRTYNKKGKKLSQMTIQDLKHNGFRNGKLRYIVDDLIKDRKEVYIVNDLKKEV
jgi:hypothetical protein